MPKIFINNKVVEVDDGITVPSSMKFPNRNGPGFAIMRDCLLLGIAECVWLKWKTRKPVVSCAMPVAEGMKIKPIVKWLSKQEKE